METEIDPLSKIDRYKLMVLQGDFALFTKKKKRKPNNQIMKNENRDKDKGKTVAGDQAFSFSTFPS